MDRHVRYRKKKRSIYTVLDGFYWIDFHWDLKEVQEFDKLWQTGIEQKVSSQTLILQLAAHFDRSQEEVALLVMDRALKGRIA
ncbi:hypothetical protein LC087_19340 (plasmid) [Bacillus carboniphilus]|uniref:Uncharacterized protein n=1 Tax=Bacillus carboniphilus TaxID=86663 RepID=A0ABY9K1N1_9BACI|nr:hypothetical protein [Bacillus carboniphilus]WLR44523.1 hypothetical protein LC087_19340 [Bacillus carboniphilus]